MLINTLLLIFIVVRFVIGVRLVILARQNNLPNIYWLAALFFTVVVGAFFAPTQGNPLGDLPVISLWMFTGCGTITSTLFVIAFTQTTFYQGRKSPVTWYAGIGAIFITLTVYGLLQSESNYKQHPFVAFVAFGIMAAWFWHGISAYEALAGLSQEQNVEDWIKSRYRMIILYAAVLIIGQIGSFIRIFYAGGSDLSPLGTAMGALTLVAQITAAILQFLVWVMPERFRQWLNRNQHVHDAERIHEKTLALFDILSTAMSEGTGLPKLVAMFNVRKVIAQKINSEDGGKIEQYALGLGYNEWLDFISSPEFYALIENSPSSSNPREIISRAKHALTEKQSLFTMQAK